MHNRKYFFRDRGDFREFYHGHFVKYVRQKYEDADEMGTAPDKRRLFP